MLQFELPYPPSINHYWRHFRGRTVISRGGRAFRDNVCSLLAAGARGGGNGPRKPPMGGRIALAMDAFPPDNRRRDIDNIQKTAIDAIQHAGIYLDDSQVQLLISRRREVVSGGRLNVRIEEFPLTACPLCGNDWRQN
jgi:crossover junction endodeoxyribonuclease RusA